MKPVQVNLSRLVLFVVLCLTAGLVYGQDDGTDIPVNADAENVFQQGLDAFREGDYGMAYRRFRLIDALYGFNRKTTASLLMAGKSLYRDGKVDAAVRRLEAFVERYPTSRYVAEARVTLARATGQEVREPADAGTTELGILLPLKKNAALTRALFAGIRLAVDDHNHSGGARPSVKMIFRDTQGTTGGAVAAVDALADAGADVMIGPIFSDVAWAAADAADKRHVVLVAPLANDEGVSRGHAHVFQANPSMTMRGRELARYAVSKLGLKQLGILGELNDSLSERMAEAFQDEVVRLGANVRFYDLVQDVRAMNDWFDAADAATLVGVEGVFVPVNGSQAAPFTRTAYQQLARRNPDVQIFGNTEWQATPPPTRITTADVIYATDYNPSDTELAEFAERIRTLTGKALRGEELRLAVMGFDVTRFVLDHADGKAGDDLARALRQAPEWQGLGIDIDFDDTNVNEKLYFHRYSSEGTTLLE